MKNKKRYKIVCPICQTVAMKSRKDAKYCSDACKSANWRESEKSITKNYPSFRKAEQKILAQIDDFAMRAIKRNDYAVDFVNAVDTSLNKAVEIDDTLERLRNNVNVKRRNG